MSSAEKLIEMIRPELEEVVKVIQARGVGKDNPYLIELPETFYHDSVKEDIDSLIARTANAFGRLSRLAGMVHSAWKIYEVSYEQEWARAFNKVPTPEAQEGQTVRPPSVDTRKAYATEQTAELGKKVAAYEGMYRIIDRHSDAARVASESARKIASRFEQGWDAEGRFAKGQLKESDFSQ